MSELFKIPVYKVAEAWDNQPFKETLAALKGKFGENVILYGEHGIPEVRVETALEFMKGYAAGKSAGLFEPETPAKKDFSPSDLEFTDEDKKLFYAARGAQTGRVKINGNRIRKEMLNKNIGFQIELRQEIEQKFGTRIPQSTFNYAISEKYQNKCISAKFAKALSVFLNVPLKDILVFNDEKDAQ